MSLEFRWTESGRRKQHRDELAGWAWLERNLRNPARQEIRDLTGTDDDGTFIRTDDDNYANWKDAHRRATKLARQERQRQQAVAQRRRGPGVVRSCDIDPGTPVRDTLRVAIVTHATSMTEGSPLGKKRGQGIGTLINWTRNALKAVDEELSVRSRHREAHDLRLQHAPPKRVFVGPEWFFRPRNSAYTVAQRDRIIGAMVQLSRVYPDWLLVPGTIFWTPDDLDDPPYSVFNTVVVYAGGVQILRHDKANRFDIDDAQPQTWGSYTGPDHSPSNLAQPQAPAIFLDQGLEWCIDICRDHAAGEAACGYAIHHPAYMGANIYIVTSNGTTLADHFMAARDQGFLIYCEAGRSSHTVHRVTRPGNLTTIADELKDYYAAFADERESFDRALRRSEQAAAVISGGHGAAARQKVDALKAEATDPDSHAHGIAATVPVAPTGPYRDQRKAALEEAHWYGQARTLIGFPRFTINELVAMLQVANLKRQEATGWTDFAAARTRKAAAVQTLHARAGVTLTELTGTITRQPKHVKVFELIDV